MNVKKIVLASISYVLITMAIAYPWHMVWFHDLYEGMGAYTRPEPSIPLGMLSMLVQGVVIAYLYPTFYKGGNPIIQGIKFSIIIGAIVYSVMGFAMGAKIDINPVSTYLLYNLIFQFIQFVSTGAILGLIYGKVNQKT
ncbi:MAG: DUF1761 domain-containing protein [Gammaproteobacteria bacterium]|nr:DUF1761 domain-containing protein [Gammaproteobacteria bacterium]MCF6261358.1 DUF1761 domain-containing protein [Gammaproteobacteria bacterium]